MTSNKTVWGYVKIVEPHITWTVGLFFVIDSVWQPIGWTQNLATHPQPTIFFVGLITFLAGREAIKYRKRSRKWKRKYNREKEQFQEWREVEFNDLE